MGRKSNIKKKAKEAGETLQFATGSRVDKSFSAPNLTCIFTILLVCFVVYSNTLFMDFVWDDAYQIIENSQIKSLKNVPSLFISEVWAGVEDNHISPYYRPIFTLSLAIDYFFWGEKPFGFHLTNLILHAMVSVLVYLLALKIIRANLPALLGSLVFAVHPVHVEAVAWVSGRNEMLSAFFMFLSLYLYILFKDDKDNKKYIITSLVSFFAALLSKETAITLPAIIFLYDASFGEGRIIKKLKFPIIYGVLGIVYLILRTSVLSIYEWVPYPLHQRLFTGAGLVIEYLRLLIFPLNLKLHYDIPVRMSFFAAAVIIPIILLGIIFSGLYFIRKYDRKIAFSLVFILLALLPVSGVPTLIQPALIAERYLYIPSAGFSLAFGLFFMNISSRFNKPAFGSKTGYSKLPGLLGIGIIIVFSILTFRQNYAWKDQYTFAAKRVEDAPNYAVARYDLGLVLSKQKKYDDAVREFRNALEIKPDMAHAYNNLGAVFMETGRYDDAVREFRNALRIKPDNSNIHYNLGIIYNSKGLVEDSIREFKEASRLKPNDPNISYNLGVVYVGSGQIKEAAFEFERALNLKPNDPNVRYNLGVVYIRQGRLNEAIALFEEAVRLIPGNEVFRRNLKKAYELKKKQ